MKSWITWDKRKQTSSMPWKKHGHTCKTNSLKKRTSNKKIYAKKKKRNKSVSMPAKHSMRQRCKKSCIPKVPIPNVCKISPTNWDKLSRSCLSSKTRNTDYRISKRQTRPDWTYPYMEISGRRPEKAIKERTGYPESRSWYLAERDRQNKDNFTRSRR